MARVIPAQIDPAASASERKVHRALSELPDPWIVIHDIPIGIFGRPRPGLEQIDFLVIHPTKGIAVIEAKPGDLRVEEGTWYAQFGHGRERKLRKSPFQQAADQRFELQRFLWKRISVKDEGMAHAVALPDAKVEGALGPDAPRDLVLDALDLVQPLASIEKVFHRWRTRLDLNTSSIERLVNLLKPTLSVPVVLAAKVAATEAGIQRETRRQVAMTENQIDVFYELLKQPRALVLGEAGTGKTVLAIERAKRLAETGQRTLLLCHRAPVYGFIVTALGHEGADRRFDPQAERDLTVTHWTGLINGFEEATARKFPAPTSNALADALLSASDQLNSHFDAVVIDEGQEFTPQQFEAIQWLLGDPGQGPLYVFADPFQHSGMYTAPHDLNTREQLRGTYSWEPPTRMPVMTLTQNCRNSLPIAELAATFLADQHSRATVDGEAPEIHKAASKGTVLQGVVARVRALLAADGFQPNDLLIVRIGISKKEMVTGARRAEIFVADINDLSRFPLTPTDLRVPFGTPDEVQGLEAQVVVVARWHDKPTEVSNVRDLYIACSRARSHLIIFSNRDIDEMRLAAKVAFEHHASID